MTEDRTDSPGNRFPHMKVDHLHGLAERITAGEFIDGPELAERLRGHSFQPIPDTVLDYLCRYLEGTIEKPKGRKPASQLERRRLNMIIGGVYRNYLAFLAERKRRYGHPVGWLKRCSTPSSPLLDRPPAEIAARLVARKFLHGEESWRTVQNISSRK